MKEFLYDYDSGPLACAVFASMLVAMELGYRWGRRQMATVDEATRAHIDAIQSSILGILALLLGFTFSLALERYDRRSESVVEEANSIRNVHLRTQLLPSRIRDDLQSTLKAYLTLRLQASTLPLTHHAEQAVLASQALASQQSLWQLARQALEADPNSGSAQLLLQSLNDLIDAYHRRSASLARHVPEFVLLLQYVTLLMAGAIVGYASGIGGHRPSLVSYILVGLIVILVYVILDLDRPRRGVIEVSQKSLMELRSLFGVDGPRAPGR